ncbi:DNA-directed RNA polymerase subunit beta', partial [Mycoplasmopsis edwardii]
MLIKQNEYRMIQEAVDALIDNARKKPTPVSSRDNHPLKCISDGLTGKKGRFRQNLLGKRVDYSARSVIVGGPSLKMYEVGVPRDIAAKLFEPW